MPIICTLCTKVQCARALSLSSKEIHNTYVADRLRHFRGERVGSLLLPGLVSAVPQVFVDWMPELACVYRTCRGIAVPESEGSIVHDIY